MSKNYRDELVGLFGNPVDENPTGVMEEAAFAEKGLPFRYLTIKVEEDDLESAVRALKSFHMKGINLTIPHKVSVIPFLDRLTQAAEIIGAVNTVINRDGVLLGDNTDGKGFISALQDQGISPASKNIVILGAGGAARSIAVESALVGADKITIVNRSEERGRELAALIDEKTGVSSEYIPWDHPYRLPAETELLINATSIGLYPNVHEKPDMDYDSLSSALVVCDVVFNDPHTLFLQEAEKRGARTVNGLGMLVHQGAMNFKLWTGVEAPIELMEEVLKREFGLN